MGFQDDEIMITEPESQNTPPPHRHCQCEESRPWVVYHDERKHRLAVRNYIGEVMKTAKKSVPYCHLDPNITDIKPGMGLTTVQAVYISTIGMCLDENRERAEGLVNAFLEYSSGYDELLYRLKDHFSGHEESTTDMEIAIEKLEKSYLESTEEKARCDERINELLSENAKLKDQLEDCHSSNARTIAELRSELDGLKQEHKGCIKDYNEMEEKYEDAYSKYVQEMYRMANKYERKLEDCYGLEIANTCSDKRLDLLNEFREKYIIRDKITSDVDVDIQKKSLYNLVCSASQRNERSELLRKLGELGFKVRGDYRGTMWYTYPRGCRYFAKWVRYLNRAKCVEDDI